jgi:hypothetical protein
MGRAAIVASLAVVVLLLGTPPAAAGSPRILAQGPFDAIIDPATFNLTPQGNHCILEVDGTLVFSGTLVGEARGTTQARIFASCDEVAVNPPGTFRDVFTSELHFTGTVDGVPASADITYQGAVEEGGGIRAQIRLSRGLQGVLQADAVVAVGGSYTGFVIVE